jgi:ElaB/YqjD/DUF883 family membrane-anchored ribosome-binding protein
MTMNDQPTKTANQTGTSAPQNGQGMSGTASNSSAPQKPVQNFSSTNQTSDSLSGQTIADKALAAGRDLKAKAAELAGSSAEAVKGQASDFVDAAKDVASQAGDRIQKEVGKQKGAGAEYVGNLANTMRRAAGEFDADIPIAATYIRKAASQVESVSDTIQNGNLHDLIQGTQSFARKQPTAFLGLAVLAGFSVVRFLKSSATSGDDGSRLQGSSAHHYATNTENRGYRDEFTK